MKLYRVRRELPTYYAGCIGREYTPPTSIYAMTLLRLGSKWLGVDGGSIRWFRAEELEELDAASEAEFRLTGNHWAGK